MDWTFLPTPVAGAATGRASAAGTWRVGARPGSFDAASARALEAYMRDGLAVNLDDSSNGKQVLVTIAHTAGDRTFGGRGQE